MIGVSIIIPTYNRKDIVIMTVSNLIHNLRFDGSLQIIVSADGDDGTFEVMQEVKPQQQVTVVSMRGPRILSGGKVTGLGANLNQMLRAAAWPIIMQMDDDHWLTAPLDINRHVKQLLEVKQIAWIRLMGVASHKYHAKMADNYWIVDWDSPELYIPSNRPHIKHKVFHDYFGYYPEGLSLGETEEGFCHQCKNKAREAIKESLSIATYPHVCVPVSLHEEIWQHVGESWQAKGE